jgi:replication-associated recombination protein RarA
MVAPSFDTVLLSEVLRPQHLGELAIPQNIINGLQAALNRNSLPNMLFYGSPGAGKTSAALIIAAQFETYMLNGSDNRKERSTISGIEHFAATVSFDGRGKVCFIDEADYFPKEQQAILRGFIEKYSSNCRFIMTANNKSKISEAILSRLVCVHFVIPTSQRKEILDRYTSSLLNKLNKLDYPIERDWLAERVLLRFPDFRAIANDIEFRSLCNF